MYQRILDVSATLKRKSLFLLGPRQTGKSTFLRHNFPKAFYIDLLRPKTFQQVQTDPESLSNEIIHHCQNSLERLVVIDEVQRAPHYLNEVQHLIETHKDIRFILTGSSARKLKKNTVNLLGGRASRFYFHPLTSVELGFDYFTKNLQQILTFGTLPSVMSSEAAYSDLLDYVGLYLKEEIQSELIVRNLEGFSRFLITAAHYSGEQLNFNQIGSDAAVPARTVREYYQVLEDTLVGHLLTAYTETKTRKAMTTAKFYFFDMGVTNALMERKSVSPKTPEFGRLFEQLIFCELRAYINYCCPEAHLHYWRSTSQFEVDFVVKLGKQLFAIETKAKPNPKAADYKGILALAEEGSVMRKLVVCTANRPQKTSDGVEVLPVIDFLKQLWSGSIFG